MAKVATDNKGSWFSRGEKAAKKAREQAASVFRPEFWMKNGESAKLIFLDKESFNVHVHQLKVRGRVRKYTCLRKGCPLCRVNDPRLVAVYRVIDLRRFPSKDDPKKKSAYKEKYYEVGARLQPVIARLMSKKQLYKKLSEVSRDGDGTATTYQIVPLGKIGDKMRGRLEGMLKASLPIEVDYAPKAREDLANMAALFGGGHDEEDDDFDTEQHTRGYFGDDDDDEMPF